MSFLNRVLVVAVVAAALGGPFAAEARAQGGFRFVPSLVVGQEYDDNLFATAANRQEDWITRIGPAVEIGDRSEAFTYLARYGFDAEMFRDHQGLNQTLARQDGRFDMLWVPSARVKVTGRAGYDQTHTPGELTVLTGLELGRQRAERFEAGGALAWKFGARSEATFGYDWNRDRIAGGIRGDTQAPRFGLERKVSARSALTLEYTLRRFDFENAPGATAHVALVGWKTDLAKRSRLELAAGPRFESGQPTDLEALATLRTEFKRGEFALAASQVGTRVIGLAGSATTQAASLLLGLSATRRLHFAVVPAWSRTKFEGSSATVQRLGVEGSYRFAQWLSLEASQEWSLQKGTLGGVAIGDIPHNVFFVRLSTAAPQKERRRLPAETRSESRVHEREEDETGRHPAEPEEGSEKP